MSSRTSSKKRPFAQVVGDLRKAVYTVIRIRQFGNGTMAKALGSGFFVSGNLFFTCAHVINNVAEPHQAGDSYHLANNLGDQGTFVNVHQPNLGSEILTYPNSDAAIIRTPAPAPFFCPVSFADIHTGDEIGVAGYPLPQLSSTPDGQLQYNGITYRVARGVVTSFTRQNINSNNGVSLVDVPVVEVNFLFVPGNSGGPIFEAETGRVIGFVHGYRDVCIKQQWTATHPSTQSTGAPQMHVETVHAVYSIGFALSTVRSELLTAGVIL